MEDYDIMTREEAEKKMEVLRQIFPIVRLVRGYTVMDLNQCHLVKLIGSLRGKPLTKIYKL